MKVLLIYTNINGFHEDFYSFGLASIISMTKKKGHEVEAFLVKNKEEYADVLRRVEMFSPRVVGFSSVSSQFHFVKELAGLIKERLPESIITCGGVHPTINPGCVAEAKAMDAVFVGESEISFTEFLEAIEQGTSYRVVDNVSYVHEGRVIVNKLKPPIQNLDELPFPARDISMFEETLHTAGYAPFLFSKGCPYLCSYCSNHAIARAYGQNKNFPRYRSAESSIKEIEEVIEKYPVRKIAIVDEIFGINKYWRKEFCEKYIRRINIPFFCVLRVNTVDEEFIRLLKKAGCFRVSVGVESGNDYIRNKIMNRQLNRNQILSAFKILRKYRLQTNALNIIGVPTETEEMIWDTIRLNRRLRPTQSVANIFYPYKGTQLGDFCFNDGLVDEKLYEDFSNERRTTVLKYPAQYKRKLESYHKNWMSLVYRFDVVFRLKRSIRIFLARLGISKALARFINRKWIA